MKTRAAAMLALTAVAATALAAPSALAQTKRTHTKDDVGEQTAANPPPAPAPYALNVITVTTPDREAYQPSADCVVWANAEKLGVGPAQLGGFNGVAMTINVKPLPGESATATSFANGLTGLKAQYPTVPDWIVKTLQANQGVIEKACGEVHISPFTVHAFKAADKK